ncbi:MAG TPA: DUF3179 domain-containing protein [Gammaproteobacteria bacterium]|mgnify:CR=1 FL=1|nr:DUF3179 domain-containing protein [Gammaproteobacteria bacterium]
MVRVIRNIQLIRAPWARWVIYPLLVAGVVYYFAPSYLYAGPTNGFDLSGALVPVEEIRHGGPPRDGIPALDHPRFVSAGKANFLSDSDRVLGIDRNGIRKAYAVKILNYHEIVNDRFDRQAVVVSYCPLCGTGMAFLATADGSARSFGVSGLLYNSDVLLYDRETDSLWSQLMKQAIAGPLRGQHLQQIVMSHTSWGDWRNRHPDTVVLSTDTGSRRNYERSPYAGYENSKDLYFPVSKTDSRYHPKELVIGVSVAGMHKAYPFTELSRTDGDLKDSVAGRELRVRYDSHNRTGRVFAADGSELPSTISYWFAWHAFHPDSEVYTAP